jgi:DNA-binding beta-propeller fold protein YncE
MIALAFAGCLLALPPHASAGDAAPALVLEQTIPLAHVGGRIDHMAIDLSRRRLIVAELGNDTVDVIDLAAGRVVHHIAGLKEPQGAGYVPGLDLIVVANGGDGSVNLYGAGDFSARGVIPLGEDADNVRIDPRHRQILVGHGKGALAVIDPARAAKLANIPLAAHPESFQLDPRLGRVYVNIPDARQIATIDLASGRQVASWTVPDMADNFPMAIDDTGGTIATVFRQPPRLVLLDSSTGAVSGNYVTCADADDVFFDPKRHWIYVSCGAGAVDVFNQLASGARHIARVPTSWGARTSLFVPELDRLFVAARAGLLGSDAAILIFRPS